ncbi:MAG: ribosome silencing factor [Bacteroidaceae bacterium]|nr:ribosome silencing factor [Bacteroidaceae bacterium]
MNQTDNLTQSIVAGIREKKGRNIVTADLSTIITAPCQAFVLCTGGSPQQVQALADSVRETVRKQAGEKPAAVCGLDNAEWVALDYGTVMVHIFLPEPREYYDLEHLWDDAEIEQLPDEAPDAQQ